MTGAFGTSLADYTGTIPRLLDRAAERDPGGTWLRTDDLTLTFAEPPGGWPRSPASLPTRGIGHGDLVMLTARTTPEYLLSWLALTALGAVTVPVNPASAPAELAGLVGQVRPKAMLTDPALYPPLGRWPGPTGPGTTGGTGPTAGPRLAWPPCSMRLPAQAGRCELLSMCMAWRWAARRAARRSAAGPGPSRTTWRC